MRLYFSDIAKLLNRSDFRSVEKWCLKNGVTIFTDGKKYVFKNEFMDAYYRPIINNLKTKYPDNWEEVFAIYQSDNMIEINKMTTQKYVSQKKKPDYDPQGEDSKKLFKDFGLDAA